MDTRNEFQRRVGVGERCHALPSAAACAPTRTRPVIADDGDHRGKLAGTQTDHRDGKLDAHVMVPTVTRHITPEERAAWQPGNET